MLIVLKCHEAFIVTQMNNEENDARQKQPHCQNFRFRFHDSDTSVLLR